MNKKIKRKQRSKSILMLLVYLITLVLVLSYMFVTVFLQYVHLPSKPEKPIPPIEVPDINEHGGLLDEKYYDYDEYPGETLLYQHILEYVNDINSNHDQNYSSFLFYEASIYAPWIFQGSDLQSVVSNHGYDYSTTMDKPSSNGIFYKTVFVIDGELDVPVDTKEINDCIIIVNNGMLIQSDLSINKSLVLTKDLNTYNEGINFEMNKSWIYLASSYFNEDIFKSIKLDSSMVGVIEQFSVIHDGDKIETSKDGNEFINSYMDVVKENY